jgi:Fic family protein
MNLDDYQSPAAGRILYTPQGYAAFVPAPLPPDIVYDAELALALSRADGALSELSGAGRMLPNANLLVGPYIRREAVQSSRIEGTRTNFDDLMLSDLALADALNAAPASADLREVRNYVAALEYGVERLADLPLSLRLVRELHARLLSDVRGEIADPGNFRRSQNWIGPPGSTLMNATYVPPPPAEMEECLAQWERFLHVRDTLPDLIQCALMHEQFEAIHPFLDGNGRVGRLLITLFLIERGRLSQPLLYLSDYIERNRNGYYDALQRVRTRGDWRGWLLYFLHGVKETAERASNQAKALLDLREAYRKRFPGKVRQLALIDALFENPYLTAQRAAQVLGVTQPTARREIATLEASGDLTERTGKSWGRVWQATRISALLSNEAPAAENKSLTAKREAK